MGEYGWVVLIVCYPWVSYLTPTPTIQSTNQSIFHVYGADAPSLSSRVWIELDAIPFVMRSRGHTLDERASTAVRQAVVTCVAGENLRFVTCRNCLSNPLFLLLFPSLQITCNTPPHTTHRLSPQYPGNIPRVSVGYRNEVEVDCNSDIHLYDLEHYRGACATRET